MRSTSHDPRRSVPPASSQPGGRVRGASVDEMGEASFPASDPPATWTWDPPETPISRRPRPGFTQHS